MDEREYEAAEREMDIYRKQIEELNLKNAALLEQNDNMHDSLEWLTNLICGISKGHPEKITNQEWQDAIESTKQAIAKVEGKEV